MSNNYTYICKNCNCKFGTCKITMSGPVATWVEPGDDDFPKCPYTNTVENWVIEKSKNKEVIFTMNTKEGKIK